MCRFVCDVHVPCTEIKFEGDEEWERKRINLLAATRTQDFNKNVCFDGKLMDDFVQDSMKYYTMRLCKSDEMAEPEPSHTYLHTYNIHTLEVSLKFDGADGFTEIFLSRSPMKLTAIFIIIDN